MRQVDVIVVGAGPAGASCACTLARAGARVILLEKETLPRYKACGGGVPVKTAELLGLDLSSVLEVRAAGVRLTCAGHDTLTVRPVRELGWLVMRDRLDALVAHTAADAGAELVEGRAVRDVEARADGVTVRAGGNAYAGRYLVAADGAPSRLARAAGLATRSRPGLAIEAEVGVTDAQREAQGNLMTFDFGAVPGGYAWTFPKADHLSAGVCTSYPRLPGLRRCLDAYIAREASLRDPLWLKAVGHLLPRGGTRERVGRGRVLLAGDAAALVDPLFGEGIYYAVRSGVLAAEVIRSALAGGPDAARTYQRAVDREFTADFRYARFLADAVVYRFPRRIIRLAQRAPFAGDCFIETIVGAGTGYRWSFFQFLRRLPRLAWHFWQT
ncbi:MAG: geranylgeranyl reductase family protein [Chloroflexi bacterium]|nr:geranylgeranyl reductase family protein [Chloroflexota bacterium]